MNLLALAVGLFIERFLTHLFHLREARWLDGYFDFVIRTIGTKKGPFAVLIGAVAVVIPVLPVILFVLVFREFLFGAVYFLFAVLVLMFSLGPRDLDDEVDEYLEAINAHDTERADRVAKELLETEAPHESRQRSLAIEEAIFVQSNNRLFGVVLWFMILGPIGAWSYRVTDMFRRRAIFEAGRETNGPNLPGYRYAAQLVHGVVAWLPARLVALAFALAGSFESAVADWRTYYTECADHFFEVNDDVVARAGLGALGTPPVSTDAAKGTAEIWAARNSMQLVNRALWVWLTAIAVLTIFGFAI